MKRILFSFGLFFLIGLFLPKISLAQTCGGSYEVCCSTGGPACDAGLSCIGGHCVGGTACGNAGQACCAGNVCNSGIACVNGSCGSAPSKGNPTAGCSDTEINTAIGCIPVLNNDNGTAFAGFVLKWGIGVGGGIAFLLIVYASFMIMTSQGDPNRLKAGQELLTSAISGIILLIFSIFILKFIGIDILGLGNFGFGK